LSNALTSQPLMGLPTLTDTENLIKFVRGQYVIGYPRSDTRNKCTSGSAETCQWKLGDVIHSNPVVVGVPNMIYADPAYSEFTNNNNNRDLVAYFCSNEGMVHAVRMAYFDTSLNKYKKDTAATELWAFIPNATLPMLQRTTDGYHEYTTDGLLRAIDIKTNSGYKTVLLGGLRSGGQAIFAIDITDPHSPKLMWEINAQTNPTEFSKIGESWSAPAMGRLCRQEPCTADNSSNPWVAIIGSGFDPNDIKNLSKMAYLTVIDIETGNIIKQVQVSNKKGNITTNIALLRDTRYGYIQKIFFGDYYGALWRIDLSIPGVITTFLETVMLADSDMLFKPADYDTSDINVPGRGPQRPITSQPRIAFGGNGQFWVYFGTGVYNEYDGNYPYQRFYGLIERANPLPYTDTDLTDMTYSTATNPGQLSWFIELGHDDPTDVEFTGTVDQDCVNSCTSQGHSSGYCNSTCKNVQQSTKNRNERVLSPPEVYGGYVFFSTYTPQNEPCGGGAARFYSVSYKTGAYESGLMLLGGNVTATRSIEVSSGQGIPSNPMIYVGKSGEGQIVAAGLVNVSTGNLIKIMLNPDKFTQAINILLWRVIR
ncbi:MAG: pilus assembly protein, partial [Thermodesulfovibrionales bacterium]